MPFTESLCNNAVCPERLWRHHRTLCREIGPRLLGTEADRRAAGYIEAHFARCGLVTHRQEYACPSWDHRGTLIRSAGGFEISPPEGGACMFSAACDVHGSMTVIPTVADLERADLKNRVALLTGDMARSEFRSESSPLQQLLAGKEPLAIIIVDSRKDTYNTKTVRTPTFPIPVCAISARSGRRLIEEGGELSVRIDARRFESRSWNIFGCVPRAGDRKIRIIAHYDTPSDSPGSKDNGSGTAVTMEVAEALFRSGLEASVEFVAFGGEEYGGLGAERYREEFPGQQKNTALVINSDSLGCCGTDARIYCSGEVDAVTAALRKHIAAVGGYHELILGKVPESSDHTWFCRVGVPGILVHDTQPYVHHSPRDIPRYMSLERLEDAARIILGVLADCAHLADPLLPEQSKA